MDAADPGPLDVLVVDDLEALASSTAEILSRAGLTVATAATVEEAAAVVADRQVRSVVLDHSLGTWAEHDCSAPSGAGPVVIVVSGFAHDELDKLREAFGDKVFAYLAKPVPPARLIEVVKAALA